MQYVTKKLSNTPINLEPEEKSIIQLLSDFTSHYKEKNVTVRIAGGWVRDKLLGCSTKPDIDIAVDTISGVQFAKLFSEWTNYNGKKIVMGKH
jgi:tRNA nucleotidyltransferase (CCA-adding enzyme)